MKQIHLDYLDQLRKSGITNMLGAGAYIEKEYPELLHGEAHDIVLYWMDNFDIKGTKLKEPIPWAN